jgi:hypothetical protein
MNFEERKKLSNQYWHYSIQRIDLLVISISGAGIYVILESFKFFYDKKICCCDYIFLKISGFLFIASIIVNLLSQLTGKKANEYDVKWCDANMNKTENPDNNSIFEIASLDAKAHLNSKWTDYLNKLSIISMSIGLLTLVYFFNRQF